MGTQAQAAALVLQQRHKSPRSEASWELVDSKSPTLPTADSQVAAASAIANAFSPPDPDNTVGSASQQVPVGGN